MGFVEHERSLRGAQGIASISLKTSIPCSSMPVLILQILFVFGFKYIDYKYIDYYVISKREPF
jgi:hypothetical protein